MGNQSVNFVIQLKVQGVDENQIDLSSRRLLQEIKQLGVEKASLVSEGAIPDGAKALSPELIGAIYVAALSGAIPQLLTYLQAYKMRKEQQSIAIKYQKGDEALEIEVPASSSPDEVEAWVKFVQDRLESSRSSKKSK